MPYWAHSEVNGVKHDLLKHLRETAKFASCFAEPFHMERLAYWAGLWHDLGKYSSEFQAYINDPKHAKRTVHSTTGMLLAHKENADMLGLLIGGHHGGLTSPAGYKARLNETTKESGGLTEVIGVARTEGVDMELRQPLKEMLSDAGLDGSDWSSIDIAIRMVFSCLVDADYLDTEAHFSPDKVNIRGRSATVEYLRRLLETNQATMQQYKDAGINSFRNEIYRHCLQAASFSPGLFSLTVPTGGGKTRSGMAFALNHAVANGMKRVIVALPYTSIIEQTVAVYRGIFGDENVLEHHSAADIEDTENESERRLRMRLATENWDMPVIVTTTVQLFESLFANRTSKMRKLHNIAGSVLILDEVQTLPEKYLIPIQDMLNRLSERYGCSIVLCSATRPSLGQESGSGLLKNIREIIPDTGKYFDLLKRVEYEIPAKEEPWSWERTAEEMRKSPQALTVVNTKKDALALLDAFSDEKALHLSTNMCGMHRKCVLDEVRLRLREGLPCYLVSTQVVEAGVDIDFPLVLRALGPLDRIVQSAGRCNREGRLEAGRVAVFRPEGGTVPRGAYKVGTDTADILLKELEPHELHNPATYDKYFRMLHSAVDLDPDRIQDDRSRLDFPEAARKFRLIGDDCTPVIVRYKKEGEDESKVDEILKGLKYSSPRTAMRRLQPYMVNVYKNRLEHYLKVGMVSVIAEGFHVWQGGYHDVKGIVDSAMNPEGLMW